MWSNNRSGEGESISIMLWLIPLYNNKMIKIAKKQLVSKIYHAPRIQYTADTATKFTANQIGMNTDKLAAPPQLGNFSSISSNDNFGYTLFLYGEELNFTTDIAQYLRFDIMWLEYV